MSSQLLPLNALKLFQELWCSTSWKLVPSSLSFLLHFVRRENNLKFSSEVSRLSTDFRVLPFPVAPKGAQKGVLKCFWQSHELDAEGSFVLRKRSLQLGCSCYVDDCAAPSLAQTCQPFGFPVSCRLVCCAGPAEMWVAVVTVNWQDDSHSNPSWLQGWAGAAQICVVPGLGYIPCVFYDKNFQKCSRRPV